jgi:hypothetical protein
MRSRWPKWLLWIGAAVLGVVGLCAAGLTYVGWAISRCGYDLVDTQFSPDGLHQAAVVEVDCGATAGWVRWLVVADARRKLNYRRDNVAVFKGRDLHIRWEGAVLHAEGSVADDVIVRRKLPYVTYDLEPADGAGLDSGRQQAAQPGSTAF